MNNAAKKVAEYGCLTALSLIFSYVESLLPVNPGIPGAKIGLANIVTVFSLYVFGPLEALTVNALRVCLSGFLFGNLFSILYAMAGCLLSFAVMAFLKNKGKAGIVPVSAAGGIAHNLGQLLVAVSLAGKAVWAYFPVLLALGTVSGILIGILGGIIVQRLKNVVY